jgi:hypothetical protein
VDGTGLGSCPVAGSGVGCAEVSDSATAVIRNELIIVIVTYVLSFPFCTLP